MFIEHVIFVFNIHMDSVHISSVLLNDFWSFRLMILYFRHNTFFTRVRSLLVKFAFVCLYVRVYSGMLYTNKSLNVIVQFKNAVWFEKPFWKDFFLCSVGCWILQDSVWDCFSFLTTCRIKAIDRRW